MTEGDSPRRSTRRSPWPRRAVVLALALVLFALGIALGQALSEGPPTPSTATYVRTLAPLPQQPATTTTTP